MRNSLDLARHAERWWGYKRDWLAEHHNTKGIASTATSVLVGFIAAGTSTIRVGSGGVMLPNHAQLVIAEQFGTLESWLLGSSIFSAQLASMLGLPFAFASHFAPAFLDIAIEIYRGRLKPSETLKEPYVLAAVNVAAAADKDKEASRLFTSTQLRALEMMGKTSTITTPGKRN